jgi:hypothetical protein
MFIWTDVFMSLFHFFLHANINSRSQLEQQPVQDFPVDTKLIPNRAFFIHFSAQNVNMPLIK